MRCSLDKITIEGFKSIRSLQDFELAKLNILIGANGAGKSNFVDFFRMLRAMFQSGLRQFITERGGADGFLFGGPKETSQMEAHLRFGQNEYAFILSPTANNDFMVKEEKTFYRGTWDAKGSWRLHPGGRLESNLKYWKDQESPWWSGYPSVEGHVYNAVASWVVYHFHDTSIKAAMRRDWSVADWRELNPEASNIAPFLFHLRQNNRQTYERIVETIQMVTPFFDDFLLEPENKGQNEVIRLQWQQKGSSYPFQPWQFSDGTLRFICLTTALLQPNPPSTVVIDEPELGLHPFALDLLAGLLKETSQKRTQLVVSTQSVSLLNHFEPQEVIVVDREKGASSFKRLEAETLANWMEQFSLGELWHKNILDGGPVNE
ncbi:MAG: AAA family ATPase [Nitrospinae bacterium]|nr:AAA family ATPase [Nitrospinota bacterium]